MSEPSNHNVTRWDIVVEIKQEFFKKSPFGELRSRCVAAIVLQHLGFREDILLLMQQTSHCSRAYIQRADGLKGILVSKTDSMVDSIEELMENDPALI